MSDKVQRDLDYNLWPSGRRWPEASSMSSDGKSVTVLVSINCGVYSLIFYLCMYSSAIHISALQIDSLRLILFAHKLYTYVHIY